MAIARDYEIQRVEIDPATAFASVLINLTVADTGVVIGSKNYRVGIPASLALAQVAATVNAALAAQNYPTLAAADTASVGAIIQAARANLGKAKLPRE